MKKTIAILCLLLGILLGLTGCVRARVTITVKDNGKFDFHMLYAVDASMLAISDSNGATLDEDTIAEYEADGYTYEPYSQDGYTGYIISKENASELSEDILGQEAYFTKEGSVYTLDIPWDSEEEDSDAASLAMAGELLTASGGFGEIILILPTKPISHNATSVSEDGKTLTWNLVNMGNRKSIHVEYSITSLIVLWTTRIGLGLAAVAVLVVAFIFIRKAVKANKAKKNAAAAEDQALAQMRSYKQMVNEGLISQEEYDIKKAELLNTSSAAVPTANSQGQNVAEEGTGEAEAMKSEGEEKSEGDATE